MTKMQDLVKKLQELLPRVEEAIYLSESAKQFLGLGDSDQVLQRITVLVRAESEMEKLRTTAQTAEILAEELEKLRQFRKDLLLILKGRPGLNTDDSAEAINRIQRLIEKLVALSDLDAAGAPIMEFLKILEERSTKAVRCKSCDKLQPPSHKFCSNCGKGLGSFVTFDLPLEEKVNCPYCHGEKQIKGRICEFCHKTIDDEAMLETAIACPNCRIRNDPKREKCRSCGVKMEIFDWLARLRATPEELPITEAPTATPEEVFARDEPLPEIVAEPLPPTKTVISVAPRKRLVI